MPFISHFRTTFFVVQSLTVGTNLTVCILQTAWIAQHNTRAEKARFPTLSPLRSSEHIANLTARAQAHKPKGSEDRIMCHKKTRRTRRAMPWIGDLYCLVPLYGYRCCCCCRCCFPLRLFVCLFVFGAQRFQIYFSLDRRLLTGTMEVLFFLTSATSEWCRYCTRENVVFLGPENIACNNVPDIWCT